MPIVYVAGDATSPAGDGKKIIAHVCNDQGAWGAGFVLAISRKWKKPEQEYRKWAHSGPDFHLGNIQLVKVNQNVSVANMVAQKGLGGVAIRYDELRKCLAKLYEIARQENASVHMPRIGCGLAGGRWEAIEPIIEEELKDVEVTVYDFNPR